MKTDKFKSEDRKKSERSKANAHRRKVFPSDKASSRNRKGSHRDSCRSFMASSYTSDDHKIDRGDDMLCDDIPEHVIAEVRRENELYQWDNYWNDLLHEVAPATEMAEIHATMDTANKMVQDAVSTGHPHPCVFAHDYLDGLGFWPAYWRSTTLYL